MIHDLTLSHGGWVPQLFPDAVFLATTPVLYGLTWPDAPSRLAGAVLVGPPHWSEPPVHRLALSVPERDDELAVASRLVDHALETVGAARGGVVQTLSPIDPDGAIAGVLEQKGFERVRSVVRYRFALKTAFRVVSATLERLAARGRIPDDHELVAYGDEGEGISRLCLASLGQLTPGHLRAIGEYPHGEVGRASSLVLKQRGETVAALAVDLASTGTAIFDPLLIADGFTDAWAFPLLTRRVSEILIDRGVVTGEAEIGSDNTKMVRFMAAISARVVATKVQYRRFIERR